MHDITMCHGADCPLRKTCYRYTAKAEPYRQSYFVVVPYRDGKCDYYEPNGTEKSQNNHTGRT